MESTSVKKNYNNRKLFGSHKTSWMFKAKNDPKQRSKLSSERTFQNNITTMEWPAVSPDGKPIANVWSYIKMNLIGNYSVYGKQLIYE